MKIKRIGFLIFLFRNTIFAVNLFPALSADDNQVFGFFNLALFKLFICHNVKIY